MFSLIDRIFDITMSGTSLYGSIRDTDSNIQNGLPPGMAPPMDSDSDAISLAFLISLSVTFAIIMILLIMVAAYITFCGGNDGDFDEESGISRPGTLGARRLPLSGIFKKRRNDMLLDASFARLSGIEGDDENSSTDLDALRRLEEEELKKMSPFEIELYQRTKDFQRLNPPVVSKFGSFISDKDLIFLKDRGIQGYFLLPSINDNVDKVGHFLPSFLIQDKLDISFTKYNKSSSTVLNYPLPYNKRDSIYFEVKVFKHQKDSNSIFSIGLTTVPYPYFRPPGMTNFSIAYESTGKLRINNPFTAATLLPKLEEGDVVGFGYRYRNGTIYITHNGKKLMDVTQNVHIDLFLSIGAFNASYTESYTLGGLLNDPDNIDLQQTYRDNACSMPMVPSKLEHVYDIHKDEIESDPVELNVNLGQIGYVFIEANVKKYGFGSVYGDIGIPPSYNGLNINKDVILQKGDDLPPKYDSEMNLNDDNIEDMTITEGTSSMLQHDGIRSYGSHDHTTPIISGNTTNSTDRYEIKSSMFDRKHNDYITDNDDINESVPLLITDKSKPNLKGKKSKKSKKKKKGKRRN